MHGRETLVIGSVIGWVGIVWLGFCAFMLGWGPEDLWSGTLDVASRPARAAPIARRAQPQPEPLGTGALRRSFDG